MRDSLRFPADAGTAATARPQPASVNTDPPSVARNVRRSCNVMKSGVEEKATGKCRELPTDVRVARRYWPRFPDFVDVCGGFILGAGGGAGLTVFVRSTAPGF